MKRLFLSLLLLLSVSLSLVGCDTKLKKSTTTTTATSTVIHTLPVGMTREEAYQSALAQLEAERYEEAYSLFLALGSYRDAAAYAERFHKVPVSVQIEQNGVTTTKELETGPYDLPQTFRSSASEETLSFVFDRSGRLLRCITYSGSAPIEVTEYTYDALGRISKEETTTNRNYYSKKEYTYDADGNLSSVKNFSRNSSLLSSTTSETYVYENGVLSRTLTGAGPLGVFICDYTYDLEGRLFQMICTESGSKEVTVTTYDYDRDGNVAKSCVYWTEQQFAIYHYEYDEQGNRTQITYSPFGTDNGTVTERRTYTYKLIYTDCPLRSEELEELFLDCLDS